MTTRNKRFDEQTAEEEDDESCEGCSRLSPELREELSEMRRGSQDLNAQEAAARDTVIARHKKTAVLRRVAFDLAGECKTMVIAGAEI